LRIAIFLTSRPLVSRNPTPDEIRQLQAATGNLAQGRPQGAVDVLRSLARTSPDLSHAHRMLGVALARTGDLTGAEAAFRRALALDPTDGPTVVGLGELLTQSDRPREAAEVLEPVASRPGADLHVLTAYGMALQALERGEEAVEVYRRGVVAEQTSPVAEYNLAMALAGEQMFLEAEVAVRRSSEKGLTAPEGWLVLARALQGQGRLSEAESAYEGALRSRPNFGDAHGELAQLIWMRTGDQGAAFARLDAAIAAHPADPVLHLKKAKLFEYFGDFDSAYASVNNAIRRDSEDNIYLQALAARIAVYTDVGAALRHAQHGVALDRSNLDALSALAQVCLAADQPDLAVTLAEKYLERQPNNQFVIALLATAWRILGDPRYGRLYDYEQFVGYSRMDTPDGWPSLEAYLADLKPALLRLHAFVAHPIGQSLRHGSQTQQDLSRATDPIVRAFFQAVDGPIRRHVAQLGQGDDPLRRRITKGFRFSGAWSVNLQPNGFHVDHVHPKGWLSSALYVDLPKAVETGREGWIKFGEPGVPTAVPLPAEHALKPEPGMLALFPSYMWHGTVPFSGDEPRLTIAFDVVPD
jgi:tetratricopeptide (TPR) repeat protein